MILTFGEWLPDQPGHESPALPMAKNCIPQAMSYRHLKDLSSFSDALTGACVGVFSLTASDGSITTFAGDATDLYRLDTDTWTDVSRVANYSAVTNWDMAKYGDRVIACGGTSTEPQYYDVGTSTEFGDLSGTPPNAKYVAAVRDFVVFANYDDGTARPNFVKWSGYNNSETYTPSQSTQSGEQELFTGGAIQRIIGGPVGIIFTEESVYRMSYAGPGVLFRFDEVDLHHGTIAPNSVIRHGNFIYFLSTDGFYRMGAFGQSPPEPIGAEKIDRWFFDNVNSGSIDEVRSGIDEQNQLIMWGFPSSSSVVNDRLLIYSWVLNRWSYAEVTTQALGERTNTGLTLDQLDTVLPGGPDVDSIPVESKAYLANEVSLLAFDGSNQAATLSGSPLQAEIDSKEFRQADFRRFFAREVRPIMDSANVQVAIGTRDDTSDTVSFSSFVGRDSTGKCDVRSDDRYITVRVRSSDSFSHAQGVDLSGEPSGRR